MKDIKRLIRLIKYGWFLNYHIKKQYSISSEHVTVLKYHHEMSKHYFEKIYDKKY